jgi:hypothetical protein
MATKPGKFMRGSINQKQGRQTEESHEAYYVGDGC